MINVFLILKTKLRRQHEQARRAPPLLLLAIPAISQYNFQFFGHWLLGKEISYAKTDTLAVELTSYIVRGGCLFSSPFFGPFLQQEDKRRSRGRRRKTKTRKRKEIHGVWKSLKSLIQHCERSELRLHFEWKKWSILASFWKPKACGQTVLPDKSVLTGQKLVENAKIQIYKCDILSNF